MGMLTHATTRPYNVNCVHTTKALHAKKCENAASNIVLVTESKVINFKKNCIKIAELICFATGGRGIFCLSA